MNKKGQEISLIVIILIILLALLVLVVLSVIKKNRYDYDSERDVCEETCDELWEQSYYNLENNLDINVTKNFFDEWVSKCYDEDGNECVKWRKKTVCDNNPEADGCICDVWNNRTILLRSENVSYYVFIENKTIPFLSSSAGHQHFVMTFINSSDDDSCLFLLKTYAVYSDCVKSHLEVKK